MKLPFINYLKALIVLKWESTQILDALRKLNLPMSNQVKVAHIDTFRKRIADAYPEYFKTSDLPDARMLSDLQISRLVAQELALKTENIDGMVGAFEIINDRKMYLVMTSLAFAKATDEDIQLIIAGKYNIHYTFDDIKQFLNYFFYVEDWSLSDKKAYLAEISKDAELLEFYQIAIEGDKDYLIWKLGISPEKSYDYMLKDMMTDCYYNFKENVDRNDEKAQKWGALALRITDKVETLAQMDSAKRDLFEEIEFVLRSAEDETGNPFSELNKKPNTFKHISDL